MKNDFVKNILERLFGSEKPIELLNGPLVRSASFQRSLGEWRANANFEETYAVLYYLFSRVAVEEQGHPAFNVFSSPQANGFYFNRHTAFEFDLYPYILDSFKDRVLDFGYFLYTSDIRYNEVSAGVQQIDRHYLKPKNTFTSGEVIDQKFGNILIELYYLDEVPQYLKVLATVYSGKSYSKPLDFNSFCAYLLKIS